MYSEDKPSQMKEVREVRETEVGRVLSNLTNNVERLTEEVSSFEARLTGITRNELKGSGTDRAETPEFNTKLAQDINSRVRDLNNLIDRLSSLRNRIEL